MSARKTLIIILLAAFFLRLGAAVYWQESRCAETGSKYGFFFMDSESYWELAQTIAAGKPYEFSEYNWQMFRTPGYPILLAPLFWLFGENPPVFAARVLGALFGTATVAAAAWLSWLLLRNRWAAVVTALILALDPLQVLTSILVLSESPFCLFMVLQIAFWVKFLLTEKTQFACYSGLFYAAAVLCRPSWLY
ncbi:MAG: ArnT family glycosyltransferase, partial [Thermoguttaceae bacterium]